MPVEQLSCAMKVDVHLPSGDRFSAEVSPATPVSQLKAAAQQHFQRRLRLTAKGRQLDLTATLSEAELRDGEVVTAAVELGKLAATHQVQSGAETAARCKSRHTSNCPCTLESGAVVTWGDPEFGGDSSQVHEQLRNVQCIQGSGCDFAAILESGVVVTWSDIRWGGDCSQAQKQLKKTSSTSKQLPMVRVLLFLNLGLL